MLRGDVTILEIEPANAPAVASIKACLICLGSSIPLLHYPIQPGKKKNHFIKLAFQS